MKFLISLFLLSTLLLSSCLCTGPSSENKVHLAIWSQAIDADTILAFEKESGLKLQVSNYSSNEELLAKLQAGARGIDVAVPSDYMVTILRSLGLLHPFSSELKELRTEIQSHLVGHSFDPQNDHSLPYSFSFSGIAFDRRQFQGAINSWADFFGASELNGKFSLLDDLRETMGAALKRHGHSVNSTDPEQLKIAQSLLKDQKRRIKSFNSDPLEALVQGELWAAHSYSLDALQAGRKSGGAIEFVLPSEGFIYAIDNLVIPQSAANITGAQELIRFLLKPENNARLSENMMLGPVHRNAKQHLKRELQDHPILFPSQEVWKRSEMIVDLGDESTTYDRLWTEIKAF